MTDRGMARMFGEGWTYAGLQELAVRTPAEGRTMLVVGMLSDAQEQLSLHRLEDVRHTLNRAKLLLLTWDEQATLGSGVAQ